MVATAAERYRVQPGGGLTGALRVPGDKSISHRAVLLGAIAEGTTVVSGLLQGEDVRATMSALRAMGVAVEGGADGLVRIHGVGMCGLRPPATELDLGNSGTGMRLLAGLLAAQGFTSTLTGDASLRRRPMARVAEPLRRMGAHVTTGADGTPPLHIAPAAQLRGIEYLMPMASAQVKSALLLAGLYARGTTCVVEPAPTRDHTERMLRGFGYRCEVAGARICVTGGGRLQATRIEVPADLSSAAFFIVAGLVTPGSELRLDHVGVNPTRTGLLDILQLMGARLTLTNQREICGEPVADIVVAHTPLTAVDVPPELVPLAIDEIPVLAVAAAAAEGTTTIRGAGELRHKESDRIRSVVDGLHSLGIEAEEFADGMRIRGGEPRGGTVASHGDHRIAMAFAMAAARAGGAVEIADCANVATSFPHFVAVARRLGLRIETV